MEETRAHRSKITQFVGSAVVADATFGDRFSILRLQTFAGERVDYTVPGVPDPAGAANLRNDSFRPVSVKIQAGGEQCSVIALTPNGPQCSSISLGSALELLRCGVRAVVEGGLRTRVPCATQLGNPTRSIWCSS